MADELENDSDIQMYIPFLENLIQNLKHKNNEKQLYKVEALYNLIIDRDKKLSVATTLKCKAALMKMYNKLEKKTDSLAFQSPSNFETMRICTPNLQLSSFNQDSSRNSRDQHPTDNSSTNLYTRRGNNNDDLLKLSSPYHHDNFYPYNYDEQLYREWDIPLLHESENRNEMLNSCIYPQERSSIMSQAGEVKNSVAMDVLNSLNPKDISNLISIAAHVTPNSEVVYPLSNDFEQRGPLGVVESRNNNTCNTHSMYPTNQCSASSWENMQDPSVNHQRPLEPILTMVPPKPMLPLPYKQIALRPLETLNNVSPKPMAIIQGIHKVRPNHESSAESRSLLLEPQPPITNTQDGHTLRLNRHNTLESTSTLVHADSTLPVSNIQRFHSPPRKLSHLAPQHFMGNIQSLDHRLNEMQRDQSFLSRIGNLESKLAVQGVHTLKTNFHTRDSMASGVDPKQKLSAANIQSDHHSLGKISNFEANRQSASVQDVHNLGVNVNSHMKRIRSLTPEAPDIRSFKSNDDSTLGHAVFQDLQPRSSFVRKERSRRKSTSYRHQGLMRVPQNTQSLSILINNKDRFNSTTKTNHKSKPDPTYDKKTPLIEDPVKHTAAPPSCLDNMYRNADYDHKVGSNVLKFKIPKIKRDTVQHDEKLHEIKKEFNNKKIENKPSKSEAKCGETTKESVKTHLDTKYDKLHEIKNELDNKKMEDKHSKRKTYSKSERKSNETTKQSIKKNLAENYYEILKESKKNQIEKNTDKHLSNFGQTDKKFEASLCGKEEQSSKRKNGGSKHCLDEKVKSFIKVETEGKISKDDNTSNTFEEMTLCTVHKKIEEQSSEIRKFLPNNKVNLNNLEVNNEVNISIEGGIGKTEKNVQNKNEDKKTTKRKNEIKIDEVPAKISKTKDRSENKSNTDRNVKPPKLNPIQIKIIEEKTKSMKVDERENVKNGHSSIRDITSEKPMVSLPIKMKRKPTILKSLDDSQDCFSNSSAVLVMKKEEIDEKNYEMKRELNNKKMESKHFERSTVSKSAKKYGETTKESVKKHSVENCNETLKEWNKNQIEQNSAKQFSKPGQTRKTSMNVESTVNKTGNISEKKIELRLSTIVKRSSKCVVKLKRIKIINKKHNLRASAKRKMESIIEQQINEENNVEINKKNEYTKREQKILEEGSSHKEFMEEKCVQNNKEGKKTIKIGNGTKKDEVPVKISKTKNRPEMNKSNTDANVKPPIEINLVKSNDSEKVKYCERENIKDDHSPIRNITLQNPPSATENPTLKMKRRPTITKSLDDSQDCPPSSLALIVAAKEEKLKCTAEIGPDADKSDTDKNKNQTSSCKNDEMITKEWLEGFLTNFFNPKMMSTTAVLEMLKKVLNENKFEKVKKILNPDTAPNVEESLEPEPKPKQTKTSKKNELDRLHENIRDMFISQDVITATGRRMCTLIKEKHSDGVKSVPSSPSKLKSVAMSRKAEHEAKDFSSLRENFGGEIIQNINGIITKKLKVVLNKIDINDFKKSMREEELDNTSPKKPGDLMIFDENRTGIRSENRDVHATQAVTSKESKKRKSELSRKMFDMNEKEGSFKNVHPEMHYQSKYSTKCIFCPFTGRVANHYASSHPTVGVVISRLPPAMQERIIANEMNLSFRSMVTSNLKCRLYRYTCPFCNSECTSSRQTWIMHFGTHTGEYNFKCSECYYMANKHSDMVKHFTRRCSNGHAVRLRKLMGEGKPIAAFICELCNFVQMSRKNVIDHLITQHDCYEEPIVKISLLRFGHIKPIIDRDNMMAATSKNREQSISPSREDSNNTEQNLEKLSNANLDANLTRNLSFNSTTVHMASQRSTMSIVDRLAERLKTVNTDQRVNNYQNLDMVFNSETLPHRSTSIVDGRSEFSSVVSTVRRTTQEKNYILGVTSKDLVQIVAPEVLETVNSSVETIAKSTTFNDKRSNMMMDMEIESDTEDKVGFDDDDDWEDIETFADGETESYNSIGNKSKKKQKKKTIYSGFNRMCGSSTNTEMKKMNESSGTYEPRLPLIPTQTSLNLKKTSDTIIYRVNNLGYREMPQNGIRYHCLVGSCSFLSTDISDALNDHIICDHSRLLWNGYCHGCQDQVASDTNMNLVRELQHMKEAHINQMEIVSAEGEHNNIQSDKTELHIKIASVMGADGSKLVYTSTPEQCQLNATDTLSSQLLRKDEIKLSTLKPWTVSKSKKSKINMDSLLRDFCLYALFKCMGNECAFATNASDKMTEHLNNHLKNEKNVSPETNTFSWLECCYCSVVITEISMLISHIISKHANDIYQCPYCFYRSCEDHNIILHLTKHHPNNKISIFVCLGEKPLLRDQLKIAEHGVKWNVKQIKCNDCPKTFMNPLEFANHINIHDLTGNGATFTCAHCATVIPKSLSINHLMWRHEIACYECVHCSFATDNKLLMNQHMTDYHASNLLMCCTRIAMLDTRDISEIHIRIDNELVLTLLNKSVDSEYIQRCPFTEDQMNILNPALQEEKNRITNEIIADKNLCHSPNIVIQSNEKIQILEVETRKTCSQTNKAFMPDDIDDLPRQAIFADDLFCAICQYRTKVRTNLLRHFQFHKNEINVSNIDPVNPVPCLNEPVKHFDKMVNLACSSNLGKDSSSNDDSIVDNILQNIENSQAKKKQMSENHANVSPNRESSSIEKPKTIAENKMKWQCTLCTTRTITEDQMIMHIDIAHNRKYRYQCSKCNFGDESMSAYKNRFHAKQKHPNEVSEVLCFYKKLREGIDTSIDTTPLWRRDTNKLKNIRGILIEDDSISTGRMPTFSNSKDLLTSTLSENQSWNDSDEEFESNRSKRGRKKHSTKMATIDQFDSDDEYIPNKGKKFKSAAKREEKKRFLNRTVEPYSFYGTKPTKFDLSRIIANVVIGGFNVAIPAEDFQNVFQKEIQINLQKLNVEDYKFVESV